MNAWPCWDGHGTHFPVSVSRNCISGRKAGFHFCWKCLIFEGGLHGTSRSRIR
ncbi:Hypothetical protein, conserved [Brucella suis ATCC 23445]|uniref:Uncharacterized protein n=1 Tax=Brucella suis (strain ATCC 23445 / NCTC 10510) TaxID=470137 RepID=A9WWG3_BRUSI|nr:Hypothetical protein, conserved [Brucella suis ATCC 23445]